jgi:hypothetical protein
VSAVRGYAMRSTLVSMTGITLLPRTIPPSSGYGNRCSLRGFFQTVRELSVSMICEKMILPPHPYEKGKRTKGKGLLKVTGKTKADEAVAEVGEVPEPAGRTQVHRSEVPRTAADHTPAAIAPAVF